MIEVVYGHPLHKEPEQAGKKLVIGGEFPSHLELFYCWPDMRRRTLCHNGSGSRAYHCVLLPAPAP